MKWTPAFGLLAVIGLHGLGACSQLDVVAILPGGSGADGGASDAADSGDAEDAGVPQPDGGFCDGRGPLVLVGDQGRTMCSGRLAETTFRYALCTCEGYVGNHQLITDAFDSTQGPFSSGGIGGSVGSNGRWATAGDSSIRGTLRVNDAVQVTGAAELRVGADLYVQGDLRADGTVVVGRRAQVGGAVDVPALQVAELLTTSPGAVIDLHGGGQLGGQATAPVTVGPPCACDPGQLFQVAAWVAAQRVDNDNGALGLEPNDWQNLPTDRTIDLPCGRYYLSAIGGAGALTLRLGGRVALFVDGDLSLQAPLTVQTGERGELDLFVAGNVVSAGRLSLGDAAHPARVRLYVGGSGTLELSGGGVFAGNIYAPQAELVSSAALETFGALFVRRVALSDRLTIHYDTAVLDNGANCAPPDTTCTSCLDCRNQACGADGCGSCLDDRDCCAPLYCQGGACVTDPF